MSLGIDGKYTEMLGEREKKKFTMGLGIFFILKREKKNLLWVWEFFFI
jgi:hypothetical protein